MDGLRCALAWFSVIAATGACVLEAHEGKVDAAIWAGITASWAFSAAVRETRDLVEREP